jgi:hypothetical protein
MLAKALDFHSYRMHKQYNISDLSRVYGFTKSHSRCGSASGLYSEAPETQASEEDQGAGSNKLFNLLLNRTRRRKARAFSTGITSSWLSGLARL